MSRCWRGKKGLLHLAPGTKEDTTSCREFVRDTRRRGLPDPLLVVSDLAPIRALEECVRRALRQRCLAHKMCNLASKLLEPIWREFRARAGLGAAAARRHHTTYGRDLPSAVASLEDDFEACVAHLKFPLDHRRAIHITNLWERLFGEERRAVLKLMYAALICTAERWGGIRVSQCEQRQLTAIRDEINKDFAARSASAITAPQSH